MVKTILVSGKKFSSQSKKKISDSIKKWNLNNQPIWFGKKHSEKTKLKIGLKSIGRKQSEESKERKRTNMLNGQSKYMNSLPRNPEKLRKFKENKRQWMLEKGKYVKSFIKKISKDEIKLRNIVKEIYTNCLFQYGVLNYELDIVIPEYKIAIEFDGYYHFNSEENKIYHKERQEKIENEGWKFLRYTMFDKFPSIEKIKEDIEEIIKR